MSASQRLLFKRARSIIEQPTTEDLELLARQLRKRFPEYQRQSKREFTRQLRELVFCGSEESPQGQKDSDAPNSNITSTDEIEDHEVIDSIITEFVASEKADTVNSSLRHLYKPDQSTMWKEPVVRRCITKAEAAKDNDNDNQCQSRQSIVYKRDGHDEKESKLQNKDERSKKKGQGALRKGKRQKIETGDRTAATAAATTFSAVPNTISYSELGGLECIVADIRELVEYPLRHPEIYEWLGVDAPKGILLHGPPGCGKTALANAIAFECGVPFLKVAGPEIVSGMSGESEGKIRALFSEALRCAPSIVFIDEIDAIAAKRENAQREMERRIVAQMLTCMDDLSVQTKHSVQTQLDNIDSSPKEDSENERRKHVVVIGATNRPDVLDPALRRAGRFDREISLGIPTEASRLKILEKLCQKLKLDGDIDFSRIAKKTPGFVGADLEALTREAAAAAIRRIFSDLRNADTTSTSTLPEKTRFGRGTLSQNELSVLGIKMLDFVEALSKVQPSLGREGFATKPDITWADIGSLSDVREELSFSICQPILHPELFEQMGLSLASGVLLYGPPGCGKTLVAKAVANEAGTNFVSIKGPELLNKYVGESERAVRQLFARARAARPCVLFFDELDALAPKRGTDNNQAAERLVNQMLTELDGIDGRQGVYLIAATNRPDIIDPALLRPGRLDKMLYVPLPDINGRVSILRTISRKSPVSTNIDFTSIARDPRCDGLSGADLAALLREACVLSLKESLNKGCERSNLPSAIVEQWHFDRALKSVKPSVSEADAVSYELMKSSLRKNRSRVSS